MDERGKIFCLMKGEKRTRVSSLSRPSGGGGASDSVPSGSVSSGDELGEESVLLIRYRG